MNEAIARFAVSVYSFLLPISWIALVVAVIVLLPLAAVKSTRSQAGVGLFIASWLFGLTTWTLGAAVTFATYGWTGLLIGLLIFGVGVVPVGIVAAIFKVKSLSLALSLIVMTIIVWVARLGGAALAETGEQSSTFDRDA